LALARILSPEGILTMDFATYAPLFIPGTIIALAAVARVCSDLSTQAETRQASRVARIEGTVGRLAGDIAHDLATAPPSSDVVGVVKAAAVSEAANYIATEMPDTVKAAGASKDSLVRMLSGEVSRQSLALAAPSILAAAASALMATPSPAPAPIAADAAPAAPDPAPAPSAASAPTAATAPATA
jgi:hypothetical protein